MGAERKKKEKEGRESRLPPLPSFPPFSFLFALSQLSRNLEQTYRELTSEERAQKYYSDEVKQILNQSEALPRSG